MFSGFEKGGGQGPQGDEQAIRGPRPEQAAATVGAGASLTARRTESVAQGLLAVLVAGLAACGGGGGGGGETPVGASQADSSAAVGVAPAASAPEEVAVELSADDPVVALEEADPHAAAGAEAASADAGVATAEQSDSNVSSMDVQAAAATGSDVVPIPATATTQASPVRITLLSTAGGSALPFTMGQALRQGHVPSGSALTSTNLAGLQFVVKNRWPDGSAKVAIVSGKADLAANTARAIDLRVAAAPAAQTPVKTADLKATGVSAAVQFAPFGTASWSGADWDQPAKVWVSGPLMSAWTYRKPIGNDPHLVAWLEVRAYKGGQVEVLPWIENGYLNVAGPTSKEGTASFTLNGAQRFSQALALLNHQRAPLAAASGNAHWLGSDPQVTPRHDSAYLMATKMVPNYTGTTPATSGAFGRLPTSYTPLMQGSFPGAMGTSGYHPSIGLLPEWEAMYLTSGGDPRAFKAAVINGLAAGRYGVHYRDETTQSPLKFSRYPTLVMGAGSGVRDIGASTKNSYTPKAVGNGPPTYTNSHAPSIGYMPYLMTGWNYFLEEAQFVATANFLKQNDSTRVGTKGVMETITGSNTTRGAAWALRQLAQTAAITPDDDPQRAEYVASVDANIDYYYARYVATPNNPLGLVQPYDDYSAGDPLTSAVWMDDFLTATFGYAKELAAHSTAQQSKLDHFLAWKYKSVVGRLGGSGSNAFSYRYAAQYTLNYAPKATADWKTGKGPWYANWGEVARAMSISTSGNLGEPLDSGYPTDPTGYWGNLLPALAYAVDHGAAGASDAWTRVKSASNFRTQAAGYNSTPVWGVVPRTTVTTPTTTTPPTPTPTPATPTPTPTPTPATPTPTAPVSTTGTAAAVLPAAATTPGTAAQPAATTPAAPALIKNLKAGQWVELPNTKIRSVLPSPAQRGYAPHIVQAWNGGTVDTARSRLLVWGGGHADYWGNEMYALDLPTMSIKRIVEPSSRTGEAACATALPDNTPTARHSYDGLTYVAHVDRFFATQGSLTPCGSGDWSTWTYDFKTNRWQQMVSKSGPNTFGTMAVYDPQTKQVYTADQAGFFAYSVESNRYVRLGSHSVDYHLSAAIDSKRRKFVMIGNGVQVIDLASGVTTTVATTNAPKLVTSKQSPGIAYDPVADRIVAWHGGGEVWALNMDTKAWTQVATTSGPTATAPTQGTFGRWGYIPQYGVFALINSIDQNAWVFKLK